ncbi:peptide chain release factor N(5)-glutamine methyltransferase [Alkalibacter rhizosphaerae]|uniref:Release factor glutamine methyltransferase n=1 Tax=Alkalibacter rhizosphaerae TaxID=2815577 RepID=A0A975AHJ7_9FIRM|nr:peptide chain release factor N(5)-glutamine methyltransferase [Alkalibacter rhizosphaerae]QSX07555.1 peptide chain release factor N(5)-glutamine methyltransferase [Alkalibacter rhizosphaerae]
MNIQELLVTGTRLLKEKEIPTPRLDSEVLLANRLSKDRVYFLSHGDERVLPEVERSFLQDIQRRSRLEPVAYITGKKEFMGLELEVDPHVLIPRPDTEILVEAAMDMLKEKTGFVHVLDIGTGSGAIAISLTRYLPQVKVTAVDIDPHALKTAKKNADKMGVADRIQFVWSDCFQNVEGIFDAIVSNPPYIDREEMKGLDANVVEFEPVKALYGGEDGLDFYREIARQAPGHLKKGGSSSLRSGVPRPRRSEGSWKKSVLDP